MAFLQPGFDAPEVRVPTPPGAGEPDQTHRAAAQLALSVSARIPVITSASGERLNGNSRTGGHLRRRGYP